jgi:hypothetical protein
MPCSTSVRFPAPTRFGQRDETGRLRLETTTWCIGRWDAEIRHVLNGRTIDEVTVVDLDGEAYTTFFDVTEAIARSRVQ